MTEKEIIIGVDCDDVVINLVPNWVAMYNEDYDDNLDINTITEWKIDSFVKCGNDIYDYIHPTPEFLFNIYDYCEPIEGALDGIKSLRKIGFRIIYVTASNKMDFKYQWLEKYGFLDKRENFVQAFDKNLININFLIDDSWENVQSFIKNPNKSAILFNAPWNTSKQDNYKEVDHRYTRMNNWYEIVDSFTWLSKQIEGILG